MTEGRESPHPPGTPGKGSPPGAEGSTGETRWYGGLPKEGARRVPERESVLPNQHPIGENEVPEEDRSHQREQDGRGPARECPRLHSPLRWTGRGGATRSPRISAS